MRTTSDNAHRTVQDGPISPNQSPPVGIVEFMENPVANRLVETVDLLMGMWCERGALQPLQILLRAYPGPLWHAYHRMELLDCLESLHAHQHDLSEDERRILVEVLRLLREIMAFDAEPEVACR